MELTAGQVIGRYQLLFRLGKGGMGEVWAAAQTQAQFGFQRLVALKVLQSVDLDGNAEVMFFDEAKAASALQHAAIVSTVDLGQDGDTLYIAMDLVRGPSLTALLQHMVIRQQKMPAAVAAYIGIQIASALDYAHCRATYEGKRLQLVHRDISPHNVLIDLTGAVKLTDFGVAKTAVQDHQSRVGTVRGKPSYMAPEQVLGQPVDTRTDLFALGTVLYETSSLKRLFGRSQPVKSMDAVLKHTPKPLIELMPEYPPALWTVIQRALQKKPTERFQTAVEMIEALQHASRDLDLARAPQMLVQLIASNFEAGAFELDVQVQELLAQARTPSIPVAALSENMDDLPHEAVLSTRIVWPTNSAPEPLAPEVLEDIRTQVYTPSHGVAPMMYTASISGLTPPMATQAVPVRPASSRWMPALALGGVAMALSALVTLIPEGSTPETEAVLVASPPPQAEVTPRPAPRPVPQPIQHTLQAGDPEPVARPDPEPEPATESEILIRKRKRRDLDEPEPATKTIAAAPVTERAPETATYEEVKGLIRQVREIDSARGKAMLTTLLEVGRDNPNPDTLNQLRREARRILEAGRTTASEH